MQNINSRLRAWAKILALESEPEEGVTECSSCDQSGMFCSYGRYVTSLFVFNVVYTFSGISQFYDAQMTTKTKRLLVVFFDLFELKHSGPILADYLVSFNFYYCSVSVLSVSPSDCLYKRIFVFVTSQDMTARRHTTNVEVSTQMNPPW